MSEPIVTRFAPSPTGFLHIGGARTALFNWLYARHHGGKMLLRIEDTDRVRSTKQAIDAILDGLNWLGINWDGETVYQSARAERHREVAEQMLAAGKAYRCYASPEELQNLRDTARKEGRSRIYDGRWRDRDPKEAPEGVKPVIRLKAPSEGETVIEDKVQGRVAWQNKDLDDFVLLRSDGNPTYMLSVVADDHDMGVTHIIRGDDHLINGARQKQIYEALGWKVPVMAHIPLIHGPDGAKLSKRHGALGVEAYRAMGFLPAALRNYLVRLGWSHGDQEMFTTDEMVKLFELDRIGRAASRFDFAKLENLNGLYIRATPDEELFASLLGFVKELPDAGFFQQRLSARKPQVLAALPEVKQRAKTLIEIAEGLRFVLADRPLQLDDKAMTILSKNARGLLKQALEAIKAAEWNTGTLDEAVRGLAEKEGLKLAAIAQPLRAALTGRSTSPGVFEVMMILGREESLARLSDQVESNSIS